MTLERVRLQYIIAKRCLARSLLFFVSPEGTSLETGRGRLFFKYYILLSESLPWTIRPFRDVTK